MAPSRKRRIRLWDLVSPAAGILLVPTSMGALLVAGKTLAGLALAAGDGAWFLTGLGAYAAVHALGVARLRPAYVLAHELTHALAAWMTGAKVFTLVVRRESGYVDLSRVNAFTALAPYWIPLYALLIVGVYRLALWAGPPARSQEAFLFLMGAAISFHLCHTVQSLWGQSQSDLDHAGLLLSISSIILLNSGLILCAVKCLFPGLVSLGDALRATRAFTESFWSTASLLVLRP